MYATFVQGKSLPRGRLVDLVCTPLGEASTPLLWQATNFVVYRGNGHKKTACSPVFYGVHPGGLARCSPGVRPDSFASRLHEKRPLVGAFCVVIIRSGSGDFFDGRFQQGDTLFDAVDFQIFFVAVEAGANRPKAVQRGNAVGRGDVGV